MNWPLIRKIVLTLLIVLSLFLTVLLWRNPGGYVVQTENNEAPVVSSVTFDRQLSTVFGPTEVAEHTNQGTFITKNKAVLSSLFTAFQNFEVNDVTDPITMNGENYIDTVSQASNVELIFSSAIPFGLYQDSFSFLPREYENRTFNRMYLSLDNPGVIYFYNTRSMLFYEAEVSNIDTDLIPTALKENESSHIEAESVSLKEHITYLPVNSLELPVLNYLVEEQPNSLFIERLFDDTSEIQTVINEELSRYYDYFSELSIDNEKDILTYTRPQVGTDNDSLSTTVLNSFNKLIQYEHWPNELYYYGYSSVTNEVEFRRYIKGYPIFGTPDYGGTFVTVSDNSMTALEMPTVVAQTPISDQETDKELYAVDELTSVLASAGQSLNDIDDIKVGYTWNYSDESNRVVTLEPNWYVKVNGNWMSVQTLISSSKGGVDDGF
ncbi:YycH family regulatory protein [Desemzia sp. FAM 23991]|uniref:YycH family regulatory protein n=1 Tax=unclassified Desemzia TaxID=2685243 RepID=UPI003884307F